MISVRTLPLGPVASDIVIYTCCANGVPSMCRLYGFLANERTKVECTLVFAQNALLLQSRSDLRGESHPDGWGIAFYHDSVPEVERRATAAFAAEGLHFSATAERIYTCAVLAHVRMATVGQPSLENCHPFSCGVWAFAHNGTVRAIDQVGRRMTEQTDPQLAAWRRGGTDSEQVFLWLLSRMQQNGMSPTEPCGDPLAVAELVGESVRLLARWCEEAGADKPARLNFVLTDGVNLIASRWNNTLHWVLREGVHDCEICGIPHIDHDTGVDYRAVVVASEPITHEPWQEVPEGSILAVDGSIRPRLLPMKVTEKQDKLSTTHVAGGY